MKIALILFSTLLVLFFIFQIYTVMATSQTNAQPYTVLQQEEEYEIRYYPSAVIATMNTQAKNFKELGRRGFRTLAGYIFGGNDENKSIAMTTPVQMEMNDSVSSMSFIMPKEYTLLSLPKPTDDQVKLSQSKEAFIAAISFGGFASEKDIQNNIEKLKKALNKHGIRYYGSFKFLGYNPPYQLVNRLNEIIVCVDWKK
jgi:hypothetical protein